MEGWKKKENEREKPKDKKSEHEFHLFRRLHWKRISLSIEIHSHVQKYLYTARCIYA